MILQAADALALLPVRSGPVIGTGVTLDGAVGALSLVRSAAQRFSFAQTAQAVVRTLVLGPVAASMVAGSAFAVSATVTGPVSQVVFTVRDSDGVVVPHVEDRQRHQRPRRHELPGAADRHRLPHPRRGRAGPQRGGRVPLLQRRTRPQLLLLEDDTTLLTEAGGRLVQ